MPGSGAKFSDELKKCDVTAPPILCSLMKYEFSRLAGSQFVCQTAAPLSLSLWRDVQCVPKAP
jgi:hypothetical protein